MNEARSSASVVDALREIVGFWRALLKQVRVRQVLVANGLALLSGLSEGLALLFLIPLIGALDAATTPEQGRWRGCRRCCTAWACN